MQVLLCLPSPVAIINAQFVIIHIDGHNVDVGLPMRIIFDGPDVDDSMEIPSQPSSLPATLRANALTGGFSFQDNLVDARPARDEMGQRYEAVPEPAPEPGTTAAQRLTIGFIATETIAPMPKATMVVCDLPIPLNGVAVDLEADPLAFFAFAEPQETAIGAFDKEQIPDEAGTDFGTPLNADSDAFDDEQQAQPS